MEVLNFIIVDDSQQMLSMVSTYIKEICKFKKIKCNIYSFLLYSPDFFKLANSNLKNKVFVFDIEIIIDKEKSQYQNGIDIARQIRSKDFYSDIIFLSVYDLTKEVASTLFNCTRYINKKESIYPQFDETIAYIRKRLGKVKVVNIEQSNINYRMQINEINYIKKEKESKYCYINPNKENYKIKSSLSALNEEYFDNEFEIVKRCYLVNKKNIEERTDKYILFDDNTKLVL